MQRLTVNHLFSMSRLTDRADECIALATQQCQPAQQARGFLPGLNKEAAC